MPLKILWFETGDPWIVSRAKEAGARLGVHVDSIDAYDLNLAADGTHIGVFAEGRNLASCYDALVVRSFMPFISETITLARLFREAGKVVIDESLTDEGYAMSKMHDYIMLAAGGVPVPRTRQFSDPNQMADFADELGYPCVVKGTYGSRGRYVHKIGSEPELRKRVMHYKPGEASVQEFLDAFVDYRVMVIGYRALPVYVSRKPQPGDFRTNFELNEEVIAHPMSEAPEMQVIAERAARILRREFTGVDIRCRGAQPLVLEANRRPGFKDFERATDFDVAGAFIAYVIEKCKGATP